MKCIGIEIEKGRPILLVERNWILFKTVTKYFAKNSMAPGYWHWLKLPNKTRISDSLSSQLDKWLRDIN